MYLSLRHSARTRLAALRRKRRQCARASAHPRLLAELVRHGFEKSLHARFRRNRQARLGAESRGNAARQSSARGQVHVQAPREESFQHFEVGCGQLRQRRRHDESRSQLDQGAEALLIINSIRQVFCAHLANKSERQTP